MDDIASARRVAVEQRFDVVIPCHAKDADILPRCVRSIREHAVGVRRIVVLSSKAMLETTSAATLFAAPGAGAGAGPDAEWSWEGAEYWPFAKGDFRWGWLYQQALKLYAPLVIPDLLPRVLLHDSDVLWRREVRFVAGGDDDLARPVAADGAASASAPAHPPSPAVALYALSDKAVDVEQFGYAEWLPQLLPGLARIDAMRSAIVHHMLVQRDVLEAMLAAVESAHGAVAWRVWDSFDRPSEVRRTAAAAAARASQNATLLFTCSTHPHARPRSQHCRHCCSTKRSSRTPRFTSPTASAAGSSDSPILETSSWRMRALTLRTTLSRATRTSAQGCGTSARSACSVSSAAAGGRRHTHRTVYIIAHHSLGFVALRVASFSSFVPFENIFRSAGRLRMRFRRIPRTSPKNSTPAPKISASLIGVNGMPRSSERAYTRR